MTDSDNQVISTPRSFRTVVYTGSVVLLCVWTIILCTYVLAHVHVGHGHGWAYETLAEANYTLSMLITFIMLPISVVVPPIFLRRSIRLIVSLCINLTTIFLLLMYIVLGIVWAFISPTSVLLTNLLSLSVQLVTSMILLSCMILILKIRIERYRMKVATKVYSAVGLNQGLHHASLVFIVFGAALLSTLGEGISKNTNTSSLTYPSMLPLFLSTLLLLVQVKHYTRTHRGWYTLTGAKRKVELYIRQYPLSELEKELVSEKKLTDRLIEGAFTVNIYNRPSWAC